MNPPEYDAGTYGDRMAGVYDDWFGTPGNTDEVVSFLSELAGQGRALELGVGTGRIALPLAEKGIEVHGIDASEAMVEKLRAKPGGQDIPVTIGDFADVDVGERFSLVYVVFNTVFALLTQEDQVRCFANVGGRLDEGGAFVLEAFVPDPARLAGGEVTQTKRVEVDRVYLETSRYDPVEQRVYSQNISMGETETKLYPVQIRYAWPSELDLMARLAGLRLRERLGGWRREPFEASSNNHVSVYEKEPSAEMADG
ncbi:MAG TPA: class I SAM-dependent methyltransferase [Rubrobacteraceae bacterium]|nr:class I SAM-dependent methyltransferase [Rubrobacteraceae bacterium]